MSATITPRLYSVEAIASALQLPVHDVRVLLVALEISPAAHRVEPRFDRQALEQVRKLIVERNVHA